MTGNINLGENVGSNMEACVWMYADYGYQIECGRTDEVVAGCNFNCFGVASINVDKGGGWGLTKGQWYYIL